MIPLLESNPLFSYWIWIYSSHIECLGLRGADQSGYEKHLRTLGIKHETIHAHTPEEDGRIESYFGRFKDDYIYTREFVSFEDFRKYMERSVSD